MPEAAPTTGPISSYRAELGRKAIHLCSATFAICYLFIPRALMIWLVLLCVAIAVGIDLLRQYSPLFKAWFDRSAGYMLRPREQKTLSGASWVVIAVWLCILVFPQDVAIASMLMLSISDALASLVGARVSGPRIFGKSLAGSAVFFLSAAVIVFFCLPHRLAAGLIGALAATIVEALPLRLGHFEIDDNLSVPLSAGAAILLAAPLLPQ